MLTPRTLARLQILGVSVARRGVSDNHGTRPRAESATGAAKPMLVVLLAAAVGSLDDSGTAPSSSSVLAQSSVFAESPEAVPAELAFAHPWPERHAIRGVTVGPIENTLHPNRGYGSESCAGTMQEVRRLGANWVSLTPFGRVWDLQPTGIDESFEVPFEVNRKAVHRAVEQAHAAGLRVLLVPHLWVETGAWRGEIAPPDDAGWKAWVRAYGSFVARWARVSENAGVDLLAVGVELRSWVTTHRAASFLDVIAAVRSEYRGPLTYAANWDDVEDTVIWGELDFIGLNAFFPLAPSPEAGLQDLRPPAREAADRLERLSIAWGKPIIFTEFGYTTRRGCAHRPWEWPEHLSDVQVDARAQADAYQALLEPLLQRPWFAGTFVWRVYADPEDVSQEPEWGFSPRGKPAELVLRDAFGHRWAWDDASRGGSALTSFRAERITSY